MKSSESINEIAKAMSLAQQAIKPAAKDSQNPHFKSSFSSLAAIWETIRQPLTDNGLTVWQDVVTCDRYVGAITRQDVVTGDKCVGVITRIVHNSGQWVEFGPLSIPLVKFDAQSIGSATSYAKRYSLCAAVGVVSADEDDDGEKAQARNYQPKPQPISQPTKIDRPTPPMVKRLGEILLKCPQDYRDEVTKEMSDNGIKMLDDLSLDAFMTLVKNAKIAAGDMT